MEEKNKQILVLQRGWVIVGTVKKEGDYLVVEDAAVIRFWGTTKGIGQLALDGVQSGTKIDPCGFVRVHELTCVMAIRCEHASWYGVQEPARRY